MHLSATEIREIITGCKNQQSEYQEKLYKTYGRYLHAICKRYEHKYLGADDILQESFIKIFKNIHQFDEKRGSLQNWMGRIVINTALKSIKKLKNESGFLKSKLNGISTEDPSSIEGLYVKDILDSVNALPHRQRLLINLFVIDGYSHKEISKILGIKVESSKSQLSRARKMLADKITNIHKSVLI